MIERQGLTLVGVAVANLDDDGAVQLALPFERPRPAPSTPPSTTCGTRFGTGAVTRAVHLGRDLGPEMPLLPDSDTG